MPPARRRGRRRCGWAAGTVRRGQAVAEFSVDEQRPHVGEGDLVLDEVLDVDAAVAEVAAVFVGFGDIGGEGDDALESGGKSFGTFAGIGPHLFTSGPRRAGCADRRAAAVSPAQDCSHVHRPGARAAAE